MEHSNGAPGGTPVRPIPPHEYPSSSMRGKVIGDEFTIALSDVPWIYKKLHLVPGPTLKLIM